MSLSLACLSSFVSADSRVRVRICHIRCARCSHHFDGLKVLLLSVEHPACTSCSVKYNNDVSGCALAMWPSTSHLT
jgi:hypothetical protein